MLEVQSALTQVWKLSISFLQELEVRLRQLANNDVISNPSDYITKAEHGRILDSRMASKDYESAGELARRAADSDRQLSIRLQAQAAELHAAHAEQVAKHYEPICK